MKIYLEAAASYIEKNDQVLPHLYTRLQELGVFYTHDTNLTISHQPWPKRLWQQAVDGLCEPAYHHLTTKYRIHYLIQCSRDMITHELMMGANSTYDQSQPISPTNCFLGPQQVRLLVDNNLIELMVKLKTTHHDKLVAELGKPAPKPSLAWCLAYNLMLTSRCSELLDTGFNQAYYLTFFEPHLSESSLELLEEDIHCASYLSKYNHQMDTHAEQNEKIANHSPINSESSAAETNTDVWCLEEESVVGEFTDDADVAHTETNDETPVLTINPVGQLLATIRAFS